MKLVAPVLETARSLVVGSASARPSEVVIFNLSFIFPFPLAKTQVLTPPYAVLTCEKEREREVSDYISI